jgi:hypothetical protein
MFTIVADGSDEYAGTAAAQPMLDAPCTESW